METRERLIGAAADLFRRKGYAGTGLKEVCAGSSAALGSLYHFFPGGKEQLAAEALRQSGRGYQLLVESVFDSAADPFAGITAVFEAAGEVLEATGYVDACPIQTVALEVASTSEPLRQVTAGIFGEWIDAATARFTIAGLTPAAARRVAIAVIAGLEGAFVLSRAMRSLEPLRAAGAAARSAAEAERARPMRAP